MTDALKCTEERFIAIIETGKQNTTVGEIPGRRLYSAVVQGVPAKQSTFSRISDSTISFPRLRALSPALDAAADDEDKTQFQSTTSSCEKYITSPKTIKEPSEGSYRATVNYSSCSFPTTSANTNAGNNLRSGYLRTSPSLISGNSYSASGSCNVNIGENPFLKKYSCVPLQATRSFGTGVVSSRPLWLLPQQLRNQTLCPRNCNNFLYHPSHTKLLPRWPTFLNEQSLPVRPLMQPTPYFCRSGPFQHVAVKQQCDLSRLKQMRQSCHAVRTESNPCEAGHSSRAPYATESLLRRSRDEPVPVTRARYFYKSGLGNDDLERQALEQYQMTNENLYNGLEQQAMEQYENSENWTGPSNNP